MVSRTRFVLGGGGAMGAYQAGALVGLLEAGIVPDALYGCSAGALNAAYLATRPDTARAGELVRWWSDPEAHRTLSPTWRSHLRGAPAVVRARGRGLLSAAPLRALVQEQVRAHDLSELAVPLIVTTTCLDCGAARHHRSGPIVDTLVASCSLPGLFAPVLLPDGHLHVDGGVVCGVPIDAALSDAGPEDTVIVLDCGLAPVTGLPGSCAALPGNHSSCGLGQLHEDAYVAPVESAAGPLDVVLQAFTVARSVANRAAVGEGLLDPRVRVVPHIADAWSSGLLPVVPRGPRDFRQAAALVIAGREVVSRWRRAGLPTPEPTAL